MPPRPIAARAPHPWRYAALYFPMGLMIGYPSVALGYLATRAGLPVSAAAAMVGSAFFAHAFKFLWAPLADYSLSRKAWYRIAIGVMSAVLLALTATPLRSDTVPLLSLLVLVGNLAATFVAFATEGLMAFNAGTGGRARASGWFQSGNQFGQTAGGGLGLWLTRHLPAPWMAGIALAALLVVCSLALSGLEEPDGGHEGASVGARGREAWTELVTLLRSRPGRIGLLLAILPIGTGSAQFLFGSLGDEWHASADAVAFVLGIGGGVAIVAGCMAGGVLASRLPSARAYALACAISAGAALLLLVSPRTSVGYAISTLTYTFALGLCSATLTGMVLDIIGERAAATKINVYFAMNTLFGLAMLRADGWAHDRWATGGMLLLEFGVGAACLALFVFLESRIRGGELRRATG
ncbi:MAG: MFS transporter [Gemmatimonadota bacterium]